LRSFTAIQLNAFDDLREVLAWVAMIRMTQENPEIRTIDAFVLERLRWAISSVGHGAEEAVARTAIEILERSLLLEFRGDEVSASVLMRGLRELVINE
jgi:hypothetical protein